MPIDFELSTPSTDETQAPEIEVTRELESSETQDLAVVWVPEGERLPLRDQAGVAATVSTELAYDQQGLNPTGVATSLGSSDWVEIETSLGDVGWVPSWNITEEVPSEVFCSDPEVGIVIDELANTLIQEDDEKLLSLLSPKRDLIIRFGLSNEEVRIPENRVYGIFDDRRDYQWGTRFASQTAIEGSFREIVLPSLLEVLQADPLESCNELQVGRNAAEIPWPGIYQNLNIISLYRPAAGGGNTFDWGTWVFAFEYIDGQPYLALLVQLGPQV